LCTKFLYLYKYRTVHYYVLIMILTSKVYNNNTFLRCFLIITILLCIFFLNVILAIINWILLRFIVSYLIQFNILNKKGRKVGTVLLYIGKVSSRSQFWVCSIWIQWYIVIHEKRFWAEMVCQPILPSIFHMLFVWYYISY
jgi:hypothetical protein